MTEKYALIIATNSYDDNYLKKLDAPIHDAESLVRVLSDPTLGNFHVQMLIDKPKSTIERAIESFFSNRERDDLLLLYFSGHGVKDVNGKLFFATYGTNIETLRSTAVSAEFINDSMRDSRSRQQVLLLDCCYSGAFARGMIAKSEGTVGSSIGTSEYFSGRGRVILTASDAMQYAFEDERLVEGEKVSSIFTQGIVNGINTYSADLDNDGRITIDELYEYVDEYVQDKTPNQRPSKWTLDVQGEVVIAERTYPFEEHIQETRISDSRAKIYDTSARKTLKDKSKNVIKNLAIILVSFGITMAAFIIIDNWIMFSWVIGYYSTWFLYLFISIIITILLRRVLVD